MRDALSDIIRQTSSLFPIIKVTGTLEETKIEAANDSNTLFLKAFLKEPVPEFVGAFGINNIPLLDGLLKFPLYQQEGSTFTIRRRKRGDREIVEEFQFRDPKGAGSDYRLMQPELCPKQLEVNRDVWDVTITPDRSRITEFQQLATLYSQLADKTFGIRLEGNTVVFQLGSENSSEHRASMVFAEGVTGVLKHNQRWNVARFLSTLKVAGANLVSIEIATLMRIKAETQFATYHYYMLAEQSR